MSDNSLKSSLDGKLETTLASEIDTFETELHLRQRGKLEEKLFAETRLRRGVYGQRYDNGQRHDGESSQTISYPSADLTKGPATMWDAPGMQRIKVPYGGLTAEQLELMAELAEEYSNGVAHITTRQDFQLHFVRIEDTPDLVGRLGSVGITTREACGNSIRNITACAKADVCHDKPFDTTPYAKSACRLPPRASGHARLRTPHRSERAATHSLACQPRRRDRPTDQSVEPFAQRPIPRRLRGVAQHQRLPTTPTGVLTRHASLPTRRFELCATSLSRRSRATIEQNLVFRWVSNEDLPALFTELKTIGLREVSAATIVDITSCPGTDTCKLGISASRGLAGELSTRPRQVLCKHRERESTSAH